MEDKNSISERTKLIREQQRSGGSEVTAIMVSLLPDDEATCVKCGHNNYNAKNKYCIEIVSECSHLKARCGCRCVFPSTSVPAGQSPATVPTERLCSDCKHDDQSAGKHKGTTDAVYKVLTYGCNEQDASGNAHCGCTHEFHFRAAQGDGQSGRELDALVAERVMGWEVLDVGYFGTEEETPRMRELAQWMDDVGMEAVGTYAIDVEKNFFREMSTGFGSWSPSTDIAAAMEVENRIEELGLIQQYVTALWRETHAAHLSSVLQISWRVAHATPAQRCRAALAAVAHNKEK